MREAEPDLQDRGRGRGPGIARGSVLIDGVNIPIAVASRWPRERRLIILQILALAETQESRHPVIDLAVDLGVVLIAVVANQKIRLIVAGSPPSGVGREAVQERW